MSGHDGNPSMDRRLRDLGIELPPPFQYPNPNRTGCVQVGVVLYCSGHPPAADATGRFPAGKIGSTFDESQGYAYARSAALLLLSSVHQMFGTLDCVRRVVKVTGLVNTAPGFERAFAVVDGASDLFFQIWGNPMGCHARTAYGVAELPRNFPIEVEAMFELYAERPNRQEAALR